MKNPRRTQVLVILPSRLVCRVFTHAHKLGMPLTRLVTDALGISEGAYTPRVRAYGQRVPNLQGATGRIMLELTPTQLQALDAQVDASGLKQSEHIQAAIEAHLRGKYAPRIPR